MDNPEKIEIEGLKTIHKLCKFGADHNMEGCTFTEIVERMFSKIEQMKTQVNTLDEMLLNQGEVLAQAQAQAVSAKLVLELEKGRFKEYEFKVLLHQSLRASKVTRSKLNWVHVMGMLGTGSTVAYRICEALGVNPDGTEFKAQEQK